MADKRFIKSRESLSYRKGLYTWW